MITIAIVDDEASSLEKAKRLTEEYFNESKLEYKIEAFQDPVWFLGGLQEERYDIYVLDVEMPGKTGLEVAREIRKLYPDPAIIFVTNFTEYAVEAYEVNTYRYIPKEMLDEKLKAAYQTLMPKIQEKEERYYTIEKRGVLEKICYDDILYLRKDGRYTVIVHKNGESRVRQSLTDTFAKLNSREFIFAEKSYVVNAKHVMGMKENMLRLRSGERLPVGTPRMKQVRQEVMEFWR